MLAIIIIQFAERLFGKLSTYLFLKHFYGGRLQKKEMKIASTSVDMFANTLFSYRSSNFRHSCLKNSILGVEFFFSSVDFSI